jgi:hypothetical protein
VRDGKPCNLAADVARADESDGLHAINVTPVTVPRPIDKDQRPIGVSAASRR